MDEYIKREDAIKAITWNGLSEPPEIIHLTLLTAQKNIRNIPTADVVPRAEAENYKSIAGTQQKLSMDRYFEIKQLKNDIEQLQAEKDALIKNYSECMKDYAREIFEEIEKAIYHLETPINKYLVINPNMLAELKKKYTEEK